MMDLDISGFHAKGGTDDLIDYVLHEADSIYVGTSKSPDVSVSYATLWGGSHYYTICDPGGGIDVNQYFSQRGLTNRYEIDQEIAFKHHIAVLRFMRYTLVFPVPYSLFPKAEHYVSH